MLFLIFSLLISISLAVAGSLTFWPVKHGYDFYIPIVLFIGGFILSIVVLWTFIDLFGRIAYGKKNYEDKKPSKFARFLLNNGLAYIRRLALITCKVTGKEKMPKNTNYLLVCNHRSNFDNFLISDCLAMHHDLAFISKPNNFKIPLGGPLMRRSGYLPINREDKLQSLQVMKTAIERIQKGYSSIGVFPEGTRSEDGHTIGPFHEGVFNIAIRTKCPIVVTTIQGTEKVKKNFPKFTRVKLDVLGVLNYEDYEGQTAKALSENVRSLISNHIKD